MNSGKKFEDCFKKSVPSHCMTYRLKDSAQAYNNSVGTKFTWDNPCDFFIFDSKQHILLTLELKSTKFKTMNFQIDKDDDAKKMIKWHQRQSLIELSQYDGIVSGYIFNFRDEERNMERTYFQSSCDFENMIKAIGKKSFNEMDLLLNYAIKIIGTKKRVNYTWDIDSLLNKLGGK